MTDFHSMTLNKNYSQITEQDLIDNPHIRPFYLEYLLSYFFGETKSSLNGDIFSIKLLKFKWADDIYYQTHFSEDEIVKMPIKEFYHRFWRLLFNLENIIYATKKSRP